PGQLVISKFETAQTHVLPEAGLTWKKSDGSEMGRLHLTGQRDTLVMVDLGAATPTRPVLEAWNNNAKLGQVTLNTPDKLPVTEANGPIYASNRYSAILPAAWIRPGVMLRVSADNYSASDYKKPEVGVDIDFNMWIVPMYLFGANDTNTQPYSVVGNPDKATFDELYAKWPVARLNMKNHPLKRIDWPYIIVGPRNSGPAYKVENADQQKDGYDVMSAALGILSAIREANGEAGTNSQHYAPLLMLGADGKYSGPGGGLGGGSRGTGDHRYAGIFIHEQGHAFGMPHAADGYKSGSYPYINGSLLGSGWGYDLGRNTFLSPYLPQDADTFKNCKTDTNRIKDKEGRCIKQDPMQGGSGDQAKGYRYTMFADFNAGVIQRYFEGNTTIDKDGKRKYNGGTIFIDNASSTSYSRWDSIDKRRVEFTPTTESSGLWGFDNGLPNQRDVAVHTIIITHSLASTTNMSQIYPVLSYQGNLRRNIDPTVASQLAEIVPNTGKYAWYCHASGCDFTVRVTFKDGSKQHVLLQSGMRSWFSPLGSVPASKLDPNNGDSFQIWGVNVPGNKIISKIELLETPMAWNGIGSNPKVLISKTL
ncbi:M66 family metalloprotease, partial [Chitinivorax sp. B]|uniref:M66 family metalloprotease n=1 Tax=Chitinivorax sp. B TaxID=2502235 RepID=UPI001BB21E96